ncbi:MAG: nucleotidyltransferase domain-containing protein [Nitrosomonas sp.]|nr:nucleotidyltransferase domain-containing protein [Nitrosomonas sp.]
MNHEIYVFGSIGRGEACPTSDVDILVLPLTDDRSQFPAGWSIYSPELVQEYFLQGRLFAWHLHLEAQCIFSPNDTPFLDTLGAPGPYATMTKDIDDLEQLLEEAIRELESGTNSMVYELGIVYTAIRDIAMSASWALLGAPCFSRSAPYKLPIPCPLPLTAYETAMLARHSSTRGIEVHSNLERAAQEIIQAPLRQWIESLRATQ